MASTKKQKGMVFHQEGATTPAAAPAGDHPTTCFALPKPGKASEGGMERIGLLTNEEADVTGKPNMCSSKEAGRSPGGRPATKHPASSNPQSDNLSPDSVLKGIRVTLDNNSMWNDFFRSKTEMILTKQGSRMFPYCRFRVSGLQTSKKYSLIMDIEPLDNSRYKWTDKGWQVAGKAESHVKSRLFAHPESPSTGQHWMQNPVSFYKLRLTNNITDQEGNIVLHPMHRYLPRLHVVQTDKAVDDIKLNRPSVVTFTFPQTAFMAVTAYQNSRFAQLKVDYNPFTKGLKEDGSGLLGQKLKLNSGKDLNKDGGTTTNEKHPMKKSLKSLLANHKPKGSKAVDPKPSVSADPLKDSTTSNDRAAKATVEFSCSSHPPQKLFSELIREAHVSLQRCNLEQLGVSNDTIHKTQQSSTKTTSVKCNGQDVSKNKSVSTRNQRRKSPAKRVETALTKKKVKEDKSALNLRNGKNVRTDSSEVKDVVATVESQTPSVATDLKPEAQSESNVKQHKRPAPLPLPALALFLKQHSSKSKKTKSKPDCSSDVPSAEPLSESLNSAAVSACPSTNGIGNTPRPSEDLVCEPDNLVFKHTCAPHPDVPGRAIESTHQPSHPSCLDDVATTVPKEPRTDDFTAAFSFAESTGPEPASPDGTPVLPNSDQPFCTLGTSVPTNSSTIATSSPSAMSSPCLDTVLHPPNSPQTVMITESSSQLSDHEPTMKADSVLPDPECSSFGFEPLSPASSAEALPSLPTSFTLQLDSATPESTPKAASPKESPQCDSSAASVFKWHTVLPPPEPYMDASFTTFQPPQTQTLPVASLTSHLSPSQTHPDPEPQTFVRSTSSPPADSAASFQENEHSLPFPAELSPLALQLPLSPSFSSLDGDGLSPTPSLTDLVHFFSTNDDLGIGVDFSNTDAVAVPSQPPNMEEANTREISQQLPPPSSISANKPCKRRRKSRRGRPSKTDPNQRTDDSTYTRMQLNLEEVEEQLFISFTSKEALKLHVVDDAVSQPQTTPDGQSVDVPEEPETVDSLQKKITSFQKLLLRDLKLMRHRQVIHPVLQEVGLKMNLLDPSLAIDLQYLGVRLPIPPPGVSLEPLTQELPPSQAFVSRTGKTTDVTQIKGWREKFTPSEAPSAPAPPKPEAGPSSDPPKKNLSAFCSDMLDEYLESEGKLIDERAASFSQPQVEPVTYELPTRSTSYVRTLDSILKKQSATSPASDLISGFVPPSKRPRLPSRETKPPRRERAPRQNKPRTETVPGLSSADPNPGAPVQDSAPPHPPTFKRRKRLKPKTSSKTLSPPHAPEHMAPLESDSELGTNQSKDACRKDGEPVMTRALLKQKDLEDGVVWEGRPRTAITMERATVALTSLFTLMGFVRENPTAPIQLVRRRAPPCLSEFCRLGCVCSSLALGSRTGHCGRPACMFGCSCLKQKVVLLKNLDGSDSSPSRHGNHKKRKRKRRMKMAYILKEADSVSQPAERIRTLWKRNDGDADPEPIHIPKPGSRSRLKVAADGPSSCARVRGYKGKKKVIVQKQKESKPARLKSLKQNRLKSLKQNQLNLKQTTSRARGGPVAGDPDEAAAPKPSKRLIIVAECKWVSDSDRSLVLKELCEKMAADQLDNPFWIKKYLISPMGQTVEENGTDCCIQYKMHISRPNMDPKKPEPRERERVPPGQQEHLKQVREAEPPEEWQREVDEEDAEPLEDWQREVEEEEAESLTNWQRMAKQEEAGPLNDWQRQLKDGDEVHDGRKRSREGQQIRSDKKKGGVALPFFTGISPAGFLSASRKQPGGTDNLIQVNGKSYPLAKIQLGKMGALHPANRLAAYLTGRVGSTRAQQGSTSTKPPLIQSSGPTPTPVVSAMAPPPRPPPSTSAVTLQTSTLKTSTDSQVSGFVAPPPAASQLVMLQVPSPPPPPASGQRMVLQPVRTASGVQFYRRPDGKLVQLVPLSQLRPTNQTLPGHSGHASSVPPAMTHPNPCFTVVKQTAPVTTVTPSSALLTQKGACTFKILPPKSGGDPIVVTIPKLPPPPAVKVMSAPSSFALFQPTRPPAPPVNLVSIKQPAGQGAELGVKVVTVSTASAVARKPVSPQTSALRSPPPPPPSAPASPEPELARGVVDLDIVCVDDDAMLATMATADGAPPSPEVMEVVEVESQSSETDNSSDFDDESDGCRRIKEADHRPERHVHNMLEKFRREKLLQLLRRLQEEVGLSGVGASKVATLNEAVRLIGELKEANVSLRRQRKALMKRREELLTTIAPTSGSDNMDVIEVVDLLDESEEEIAVTKTADAIPVAMATDPHVRCEERVAVETMEEDRSQVDATLVTSADSQRSLRRKTPVCCLSVTAAVDVLRSVMNAGNAPLTDLLHQAQEEIQTLQRETGRLKSLKICLNQQRNAYIREISRRSGKSEEDILRKLLQLSSKQRELEEQAANQPPADQTEGGASASPAGDATDDVIITPMHLQRPQTPQAPPTTTPVQQAAPPPPTFSHNASVAKDRPRTVPNILSRRKNPAPPTTEAASLQVLGPPQVLSLVGAALPGQQVLTLNPLVAGAAMLQTPPPPGRAPVTLHISSLTNQQIHVNSVPRPPAGKIYSSPAPITITNLTAANFNNLLQLVQPSASQQSKQQQTQAPSQHPAPPPPPRGPGVEQPSRLSVDPRQSFTSSSQVSVGGLRGTEEAELPSHVTLTSLLNDLVLLNQQGGDVGGAMGQKAEEQMAEEQKAEEQAFSPWLLQLDSDSDDNAEAEEAALDDRTETTQSGSTNANAAGGILAPPPLLQMKVGGANMAEAASRQMPRLVPLGLRGNLPS